MAEKMPDADLMGRIGRASLRSFIVFLSLSALFAIATVLFGEFGDFEAKVLATTSVIAIASICSMCCSAHARRKRASLLSVGGILLAVAAAAAVTVGIWAQFDCESYWKTAGILGVFALAAAHALALLAVRLPTPHRWLQIVTAANIAVLAIVIASMIVVESGDRAAMKLLAVLAILVALETLVIPIVARLSGEVGDRANGTLSLTRREDGLYEDRHGVVYDVKPLSDAPAGDDQRPQA
jgi:hypothetical protein